MHRLVLPLALLACSPEVWAPDEDVSDALEVILTDADGLNRPQDLAFDNAETDRLWIVNRRDFTVTIVHDASTPGRTAETRLDPAADHFLENVSSIAFGMHGMFGTCQDSRNTYGGVAPPNDFMGPALWSSDLSVFAQSNPEAVAFLTERDGRHTDLGSHLDMLHESPLCVGIAWETDNVYWVFDGMDGAIVRYDFVEDHGPGFNDHSNGVIHRYRSGDVARADRTVSHLAFHHDTGTLFIADSGNGRLATLDTTAGELGRDLPAKEAGTVHKRVVGAFVEDFVTEGLVRPAGLHLVGDRLLVTDAETAEIHIFDLDGRLRSTLSTGLGAGALAGIWAETLDDIWLVDARRDQLLRLRR